MAYLNGLRTSLVTGLVKGFKQENLSKASKSVVTLNRTKETTDRPKIGVLDQAKGLSVFSVPLADEGPIQRTYCF